MMTSQRILTYSQTRPRNWGLPSSEPGALILPALSNAFVLPARRRSLPELMEKKKSIDMHTNIATALLEQIKVCSPSLPPSLYIFLLNRIYQFL